MCNELTTFTGTAALLYRSTNDVPAGWAWDTLTPGSSLPFAWDDITSKDKSVVVAAGALGPGAHRTDQLLSAGKHNTFVLDLDSIQVGTPLCIQPGYC